MIIASNDHTVHLNIRNFCQLRFSQAGKEKTVGGALILPLLGGAQSQLPMRLRRHFADISLVPPS